MLVGLRFDGVHRASASLGARRAFTIAGAPGGGSDSGRATIERLGLDVVEVGRPARPDGLGFSEAEFIVTGLSGAEFPFAAFGPHIRHMILLTGLGGERLWGVDGPVSRDAHQNDDPAGASLAEFCRRCSFVHLPVGWIGFESQPELQLRASDRPPLCRGERHPARVVRHQQARHGD